MALRKSDISKGEILFGDFVFRTGINVTIRRGLHWYGKNGTFVAKPSDVNDERKKKVEIIETVIYRFRDLPARVINIEHDERARNYSGLIRGMKAAYGEEFDENEYVTVIYFNEKL